jgi:uncharacterized protein YihD (DUF1040 family)
MGQQQTLRLNDVLASLDDDGATESTVEKTASAGSAPSAARQELLGILSRGRGTEKTASDAELSASHATPAGDLEKIAEQVQAAETDAMIKEAHFFGTAVCDGFMARMSQYQEAAGVVQNDEPQHTEYGSRHEKVAQEVFGNIEQDAIDMADEMIKEAAEQGVELTGEEALEKIAQEAHTSGANELLEVLTEDFQEAGFEDTLEKMAEDFREAGFEDVVEALAGDFRAEAFEATLEKIAEAFHAEGDDEAVDMLTKVAFEQGYEDAMEKIAESAFNHGYEDMAAILDQAG